MNIQRILDAIMGQNQTFKSNVLIFAFDATVTTGTQKITRVGLAKHLHLVVPNFTNDVTATVTLVDASGRILWTSAAKARNASYNLETEAEWFDQLVDTSFFWKVTLSGAAGAGGGTVTLIPRYYGV